MAGATAPRKRVANFVVDPRFARKVKAVMIGFPILKGLILGGITTLIVADTALTDFVRALIVAVISASIGAVGVIGAAYITARADRDRYEAMLTDLKQHAGLTRRANDPEEMGNGETPPESKS